MHNYCIALEQITQANKLQSSLLHIHTGQLQWVVISGATIFNNEYQLIIKNFN